MAHFQIPLSAIANLSLRTLERARRGPQMHGALRLVGLHAAVEVIRDRYCVPHIYAQTVHDLLFAQGFVHAQDRLWQMDFQRRMVAGRLAEVVGPAALPSDRGMRILGLRRVAEAEVNLLSAEARADLEAYAAGVNACVARQPLPIEFTLLGYRPHPWTPADSLSWAKMMSWSLSANWETELLRAALVERLGPEMAAELEPPSPAHWPTVMPSGGNSSRPLAAENDGRTQGDAILGAEEAPGLGGFVSSRPRVAQDDEPEALPHPGSALGSNNWVVAGWRSATGMPLLANDMHLLISTPAIWYENHLQCGDLNVAGVTFPGVPYVTAGHNGHVAWGFTNGYADVQDLYMERLRRMEDGRVQYEYREAWLDAEVRREVIKLKGREPVVEEVIITRHGPIINALAPGLAAPATPTPTRPCPPTAEDLSDAAALQHPLALRWTSLEPRTVFQALQSMNRAHTCTEFREALRDWSTPVQNVVYADTLGNIAYSYPGWVPIRARGDGRVPVPGWSGEDEWLGYVPFDELPHQLNPAAGYVASANNRVADASFPHFLGREFCMGDRAGRIVDLLNSRKEADPDFFRGMQLDQVSSTMCTIARHLGELTAGDPELAAVIALVRRWDGRLTADSPAAAVCEIFGRLVMRTTLEGKLGDLTERALGQGPTPMLQESSLFSQRTWEWLLHILALSNSGWFNLGDGEGRDDVLRVALRKTVSYLHKRLGPAQPPDFEAWAWGRLHTLVFTHLVGRTPALSRHFNRGPYPLGGDGNTLWATGSGITPATSTAVVGPPFRFIADLGDLDHCLGVLVPGNSGRPESLHYDDQIDAWMKGEYHLMLYARQDVDQGAKTRLLLESSSGAPRETAPGR